MAWSLIRVSMIIFGMYHVGLYLGLLAYFLWLIYKIFLFLISMSDVRTLLKAVEYRSTSLEYRNRFETLFEFKHLAMQHF